MALRCILDCDPGQDDAVAIAIASQLLDVAAVASVAGNANVDDTTRNALRIVRSLELEVPVHRGAEQPLARPLRTPTSYRGSNGFSGWIDLPGYISPEASSESASSMYARRLGSPTSPVVIATGPLTNLAQYILSSQHDQICRMRVFAMVGAINAGNVAKQTELNAWSDPEALEVVLAADVDLTILPIDTSAQVRFDERDFSLMEGARSVLGGRLARMLRYNSRSQRGLKLWNSRIPIHDAVAIALAARPELFSVELMYGEVATSAGSYGKTRFSSQIFDGSIPVKVATRLDVASCRQLVTETIAGL